MIADPHQVVRSADLRIFSSRRTDNPFYPLFMRVCLPFFANVRACCCSTMILSANESHDCGASSS